MAGGEYRLPNDQGGHLIGTRFNGSEMVDNIVAMDKDVNLKVFRKLENKWADAIDHGQKVNVKMDILYDGTSLRPSNILVEYSIDGDVTIIRINNIY